MSARSDLKAAIRALEIDQGRFVIDVMARHTFERLRAMVDAVAIEAGDDMAERIARSLEEYGRTRPDYPGNSVAMHCATLARETTAE